MYNFNFNQMTKHQRLKMFTMFFLLWLFSFVEAYGQEQRVTVNLKNASLKEVFNAIEKQTTYRFSYRNAVVDNKEDISISQTNASVPTVLNEALKNRSLDYKIVSSKMIVVSDKETSVQPSGKSRKLSGVVKDEKGEPIIGASVVVQGTTNGSITDLDGHFTLNDVSNAPMLTISYVGFVTQNISTNLKSSIKVQLAEDTKTLDEVVVIGYGTQRKGDLTSSVGSVKKEDFIQGAVKDAGQLIQGKVAGLAITNPSGDPVSGTTITLRGNTTILGASTNPLVLVDGVPGDLNTVAPEDIETVD